MIEERAVVSRLDGGTVWVKAFGPGVCPRCAQGQGCGGGIFSKLIGMQRPEVPVRTQVQNLSAGDTVIVALDEAVLMRASLSVYLAPLAGMFVLGAFAQLVLKTHDLLVAGFGIAGLAAGFLWTRMHSQRAESSARYRPLILRKDSSVNASCARLSDA